MGNEHERKLWEIAVDIKKHWPKPYFGAVPYIKAMSELDHVGQMCGADPARHIVNYFLANASTWRGDDAKRIKAELRSMLK